MNVQILILFGFILICNGNSIIYNEQNAQEFITRSNSIMSEALNKKQLAHWAFLTNMTEENRQNRSDTESEYLKLEKERWQEIIKYHWQTFENENLKRQFKKFSVLGRAALPDEKLYNLSNSISEMEQLTQVTICEYKNASSCDLSLLEDGLHILQTSRNAEELKHIWLEWFNKAGRPVKTPFVNYVAKLNEVAKLNNFADYSEYWLRDYETSNFRDLINNLWLQVKPLFKQLHAYFRHKLRTQYGDLIPETGPIPDQFSINIHSFETLPYPNKATKISVTSEMISQNYTTIKMLKLAEEFFTSIGLDPMPESFWEKSIFEKPTDREIDCFPMTMDFYDSKDFRLKICANVDEDNLFKIHYTMGHIEYYMAYKDQPLAFKDGANPGFKEAIGETIFLSVMTPKHLRQIGLLKSDVDDKETVVNYLYLNALEKITYMPYAYVVDLWRWGVFKGEITPNNYSTAWWNLKKQYEGVQPPVERTENDFDPGIIYHVTHDAAFIQYFIRFVLQFQFHKALCQKANQYQPDDPNKQLHMCDIYNSTEAGKLLKDMLKMGASKPWPDALEIITGSREMDASPILEYFKPVYDWLKEYNTNNNVFVGWDM